MICLDTNVVSESMRAVPEPMVAEWLKNQPLSQTYITAVTKAELLFGVERMPPGKKRSEKLAIVGELLESLEERTLSFDSEAAAMYALILARRLESGRPMSVSDAQIAAICRARQLPLATRNTRDFRDCGLSLIDPWLA